MSILQVKDCCTGRRLVQQMLLVGRSRRAPPVCRVPRARRVLTARFRRMPPKCKQRSCMHLATLASISCSLLSSSMHTCELVAASLSSFDLHLVISRRTSLFFHGFFNLLLGLGWGGVPMSRRQRYKLPFSTNGRTDAQNHSHWIYYLC